MKIMGIILILWGILDIAVSWFGIDLYDKVGVTIPDSIYFLTPLIPIVIGGIFIKIGD